MYNDIKDSIKARLYDIKYTFRDRDHDDNTGISEPELDTCY